MKVFDTIAAIATPYGKGGVAVIRISGADAIAIADRIFVAKNSKKVEQTASHKAVYGEIVD